MFDGAGIDTPPADLAALRALLRRAAASRKGAGPLTVVEVGSWAGRTALNFLAAGVKGVRVFCVDHWQGSPGDVTGTLARDLSPEAVFQTFCANAGVKLFRDVFPLRGPSLSWAKVWSRPADLVFLDASHDRDSVRDDTAAWAKHVRPGGLLCWHDYGTPYGHPGVTAAVDAFGHDGTIGACVAFKQF